MPQANKTKHITVKQRATKNVEGQGIRPSAINISSVHKPSHSQTLMRQAVKKPGPSLKRKIKINSANNYTRSSIHSALDVSRAELLKHKPINKHVKVKKSDKIHHFTNAEIERQLATLTPEPKPIHEEDESVKVRSSFEHVAHSDNKHVKTMDEILEKAFNQATKHLDPPAKLPKKKNYKLAGAWTISLVLLLLVIAGIGYNFNSLKLRAASSKAGFSVLLPRVKPTGYSLANLSYSTGTAAAVFQNKSNISYSIVQKSSSWNSRQLQNNFVALNDNNYVVVATSDRTIYLYGSRNATWVNNGVWYLIQSTSGLSDSQLVDMANSLN